MTIAAQELAYPIRYLTAGKNVDPQIKLLNELLQEIAVKQGATYVDVYDISNECNADPHPTVEGHKKIANRLETAMMEKITAKMAPVMKCGDVDGDEAVTVLDATFIQRKLVSIPIPSECNDIVADTDGDGEITIIDATYI